MVVRFVRGFTQRAVVREILPIFADEDAGRQHFMAKLNVMGASRVLGLGGLSMDLPVDDLKYAVGPVVPELHFLEKMEGASGFTDCLFVGAMNSLAIDIEGDGKCWGKRNNRAVAAMEITILACMTVCFNIKFGEQGKTGDGLVPVLVTLDMPESWSDGEGSESRNDTLNDIPIRFECHIRDRIFINTLFGNSVDEAAVVGGQNTR